MKRALATLLMVLTLVGYVGLTGALAAGHVVSDNFNGTIPGPTNLFGADEARNDMGGLPDRDVGMALRSDDRWSPYPPYHHNDN